MTGNRDFLTMGAIAKPVVVLALFLMAAFAAESVLAEGGRGRSGGGHAHFSGGAGAHSGGSARFSGAPRTHFRRHFFGPTLGVFVAAPLFWPGYFYPPAYYYPPVVEAPYGPTEYIEQGVAPAAPPQSQAMWYYCAEPEGYYPYVLQCPGGWQAVPPLPPPPPQ